MFQKKRRGRLIAIEGTDASGKKTQTELLVKKLRKEKIKCVTFSFPDYSSKYGKVIRNLLDGKVGDIKDIDPYFFANLYAEDRKLVRQKIEKALQKGIFVICDRYVMANLYHVPKFKSRLDQKKFIKWEKFTEYRKNKMPKEDITFLLYAPIEVKRKLILSRQKKQNREDSDINERNTRFLDEVQKVFLREARFNSKWKIIDCSKGEDMLLKEEISDKIFSYVKNWI